VSDVKNRPCPFSNTIFIQQRYELFYNLPNYFIKLKITIQANIKIITGQVVTIKKISTMVISCSAENIVK
jgi:hypothetical protein